MNTYLNRIYYFRGNPREIGFAAGCVLGSRLELVLYIQTWPVRVLAKSGIHLEDIQQQAKGIGRDLSGLGSINILREN